MQRVNGELFCRSKGQRLVVDAPEKMFANAVETAKVLDLHDGWIYRCEYLNSTKHNTLNYGRIPHRHLIIFDICPGLEAYLSPEEKFVEASRIDLECVPLFHHGNVSNLQQLTLFLERESVLGGCKVEGFVVKNYAVFTPEKKVAIGKFVSEAFKEKHGVEWKASNPTQQGIVESLIKRLKTEARWKKSIQHLRDAGQLEGSPRDIGPFLKELQADVQKEESEFIASELLKHFGPQIWRGVIGGFPEFYKQILAEGQFKKAT